ncbi:hypothetical protein J2Y46_002625 [Microbacterium sp. BE35]|uniref:hypothetical protein n=1 Tax=Microbacterium sp. BE35 TaxID=2817773 RepID=UPI00285ED8CD|nr:hypothetical protein [Microbacterium sp. BE35]MDR7189799.1 hypothetical protein [Microbacterium sp. BE35]
MDLKRGYALDFEGRLVRPGLSEHVYERNFVFGEGLPTAPAWLQTPATDGTSGSSGTGGVVVHGTTPGSYLVNTGSTLDNVARLATAPIPMDQYAAIMFQCSGVQFSNANAASDDLNVLISFGIHSVTYTGGPAGNAGARIIQRNTDSWARFAMPGVTGDFGEFGASFRTLREGYRFRNMGFLLYTKQKEAVFFEDDPANPVATLDASAMLSGSVCGALMMQTKAAVNQAFRLGGVKLTLFREPLTL